MARQFPPEWYAHQAARRKNKAEGNAKLRFRSEQNVLARKKKDSWSEERGESSPMQANRRKLNEAKGRLDRDNIAKSFGFDTKGSTKSNGRTTKTEAQIDGMFPKSKGWRRMKSTRYGYSDITYSKGPIRVRTSNRPDYSSGSPKANGTEVRISYDSRGFGK